MSEISHKRKARRLALQALYQWMMSGADLYEIEAQFRVANNMAKVDLELFQSFLYGIPKENIQLEEKLMPFLENRSISELNPIELTVLRLASYELIHHLETPYKVVLDEAVSMTKEYGSQDGYKYVNGVLNKLAKTLPCANFPS